MRLKSIVSATLLLIVAAAVVAMLVRKDGDTPPEDALSAEAGHANDAAADHVAAVYFHGDRRCQTCETIEAYAAEAVKSGFPDELADGRIRWSTINYDQPANVHFVEDYGLSYQMVILIEYKNGTQLRWTALSRIWDLVQDKPAFLEYVRTEVAAFMKSR